MSRFENVRSAVTGCLTSWRIWLVQFVGNIALFALFFVWLLIPVANGWYLTLNVLVALLFVVGVLSLHAGTLNYLADRFRDGEGKLAAALKRALPHLVAILLCVAVFGVFWLLLGKLDSYQAQVPPYIRSILPAWIRRVVTLHALDNTFTALLFLIRWLLLPGLFLPLIQQTADCGFRGLGRAGWSAWKKSVGSLVYWVLLLVAALLGVIATDKIMQLTPDFRTSTFHGEAFSLVLRLAAAYVLGLLAWLTACSFVSRLATSAEPPSNASGNSAA